MEHKMHKASRQLSDAETMEILKKGDHGTLSVQGDDGYPYATPINYIVVDGKVYLHSAPYGYKIECLQRSPKCCFSAIISAQIIPSKITAAFESVVLTGTAVFVTDQAEKRTVLENFVTQKHPGYEELGFKMIDKQIDKTAVIRLDPVSLTGKAYRG
ncbi:pyridoxamine 5'-phosphate oxidase family protein [Evtepia sp.]|nr:pyridoxamine 5'-phosphate oxidase family protein [Candidatus Evtepia faecavium]